MQSQQKSDKLHIIDQSTLEQVQQNGIRNATEAVRKIRNSKYKRHHNASASFDLLTLITVGRKSKIQKARAHYRKGATLATQPRYSGMTKRGKIREDGLKKKSKLKKLVLKYRLQKNLIDCPKIEETKNHEIQMDTECITIPSESETLNDVLNIQTILSTEFKESEKCEILIPERLASLTDRLDNLEIQETNKKSIHSRRFREYCDNCTTPELANLSTDILKELDRFQKRAYAKNPIKANAHRRFVIGFREVQNHLRINKIKFVLIATDCEKCTLEGGIDDSIESIKITCKSLEVPYAFALQRRSMSYALNKRGNISCVGILDYDGIRDKFTQFLSALERAREKYLNSV